MELSTEVVLRLLLAANIVLLGATSIALLRFYEQARRFEKFWNSPAGMALADSRALAAERQGRPTQEANAELDRKITELSSIVRTLAGKQRSSYLEPADGQLPIENAVRMARHGASIDDLIRSCGLNIGEAQLMRKLHGKARAAIETGPQA